MTTLRKININGIRSYNPNKVCTIDFLSPITVIVGRNGSGKTSIIEALKYLCTGLLPPDSQNGKNFICDRKLGNSTTISACIELEFLTFDNKIVTATRNFKTFATAARKTFKGIDGVLKTVDNEGNVITGNHTVTSFDKIIPQLLRSNKAILENVIFCHQEDSLWPLSDSSGLKNKFDSIFCSAKFSKSLEVVIKQRKVNENNYKEELVTYERMRILKEQALNIKTERESLKASIKEKDDKIKTLTKEADENRENIEKLNRKINILENLQEEIKDLKSIKTESTNKIEMLKSNITDVDFGFEIKDKFEASEISKTKNKELDEANKNIEKIESTLKELYKEKGILENYQEIHKIKMEEAKHLASTSNYKLSANNNELQEKLKNKKEKFQQFLEIKNKEILTRKEDIHEIKSKTAVILNRFKNLEKSIKYWKNGIYQNKIYLSKKHNKGKNKNLKFDIAKTKRDIDTLEKEIENLNKTIQLKEEKIRENDQAILNNNGELEEAFKYLNQLKELEENKEKLNYYKKSLEIERDERATKIKTLQEMKIYKSIKNKKKYSHLNFELKKLNSNIKDINSDIERENIAIKKLIAEKDKKETKLKSFLLQINSMETETNLTTSKLKKIETQIKTNEKELQTLLSQLKKEGFNITQKNINSELEKISMKIKETESFEFIHKLIEQTEKTKKCGFCATPIRAKQTLERIKSRYKETSEPVSPTKKATPKKVKQTKISFCQNIEGKLKSTIEKYSIIQKFEEEICLHKKEVEENKSKTKKLKENLTEYENKIADLKSLIKNFFKINENTKGILNRQNSLKTLMTNSKIDEKDFDVNKISETESKIQERNLENENIAKNNRLIKSEILIIVKSASERKEKLEEKIKNLDFHEKIKNKNHISTLNIIMDVSEKNNRNVILQKNKNKIIDQTEALKEYENLREQTESKKRDKIKHIESTISINSEISQLTEKIKKSSYCIAEIQKQKGRLNIYNEERTKINKFLNEINILVKNFEIELKIEKIENKIQTLSNDIKEKEQLHASKTSFQTLQSKIEKRKKELEHLLSQINSLKGIISEQQKQIFKLNKELESGKLNDINENYRISFVKMQAFQKMTAELKQLYKDIEFSLMSYHSTKMKEVNEVLADLWRSIYTGNDIEYIFIDSKNENNSNSKRTNNYNYSIVMMQNRKLLPLKGRCSAGQKVLASLLIRLALSEVFCANCGILTLDEPTTNLDDDNIEALAEAIVRVIQRRIALGNFQMILITHDEKFVEKLRVSGAFDEYYRVTKDEHRFSTIAKKSIYN